MFVFPWGSFEWVDDAKLTAVTNVRLKVSLYVFCIRILNFCFVSSRRKAEWVADAKLYCCDK